MKNSNYSIIFAGIFAIFNFAFTSYAISADRDVTLIGTEMYTTLSIAVPQPESIAEYYNYTLPDEDYLSLPVLLVGLPEENTLKVFFNDVELPEIIGLPNIQKAVDFTILDIAAVKGLTGTLKLVLTNTGTTDSTLLLIDEVIDPEDVVVAPAAAPEVKAGSINALILFMLLFIGFTKCFNFRKISGR